MISDIHIVQYTHSRKIFFGARIRLFLILWKAHTILPCLNLWYLFTIILKSTHHCGVMVSVLVSSAVDRGLESFSGQTKDYKIGICCFSAKHTALRRKSKDWLAWNQDNVSECTWGAMSIRGLVSVSCHYKNPTQHVSQVQSDPHHHIIENKLVLAMIWLDCWRHK